MDAGLVAGIVGAVAAVGALVWAMMGNPNLLSKFRGRLTGRPSARSALTSRKIEKVDWRDLERGVTNFLTSNSFTYDLVVGLHPDGVAMANQLAQRLNARFSAIDKRYPGIRRSPFFVFEDTGHARSRRESTTDFQAPVDLSGTCRVLVVDGVTTFGNALIAAEVKILKALPGARIDYFVYGVDEPRLNAQHPEIATRLSKELSIDNHTTWLHFPWDAT